MTKIKTKDKPKGILKRSKLAVTALLAMVFTVIASITVFADGADTTFDLGGAMGTAMSGVSASVFEVIGAILPTLLTIIGVVVAIGFGISMLRRVR